MGARRGSVRFRASVAVDATSMRDAMRRAALTSTLLGLRPSRPPVWDRMPDTDWRSLQTEFQLPDVTSDGVDVRAYLEHLWAKLREGLAEEGRQVPLRAKQDQLKALLLLKIGDPMPRLVPDVAGLLAGMGMLDLQFGNRDTATYRTLLTYVCMQERVTLLIHDWAAWVAMFGAFRRSHIVLHGGSSSLAEVTATSELIHFLDDILEWEDSNWASESTKEKRVIGSGRRARIEPVYRPIGGRQTQFIRAFLTLAGVRNTYGDELSLAQARQRILRCSHKMRAGVDAGLGENALWEFLKRRHRASVLILDP
jgi:hypothetical protein